jgi:ribosomal protein L11 methylase PrmA
MALKKQKTVWGDYYSETNYSREAFEHKKSIVQQFISRIQPRQVWDLGANTGVFSRIANQQAIPTVAFDSDPVAIERLYQACKDMDSRLLLPLIMDVTNTSASVGWSNRERMSFFERGPADMVLALALIHHLAIGNNVPFSSASDFFSRLCQSLVIEFVPKQDSQVKRMLASREDIFDDYEAEVFEREFSRNFEIEFSVGVNDSLRTLYLMRRK